ncbi:RagB/SusD family nutrient uptake outer membrane protein [Sphingobacterium spiritivorum]|uniref:RagB/SusD family nutrient uptake outer membrane protein n=1 Tax=Sphingobacterium spiritivorum TaxID=258 RepID=UPI003DA51248
MKLRKSVTEIFLISTIISFTLTGCNSFLDIAAPKTELSASIVFTNNSTANAAITSIYARMSTVNGTPFSNLTWLTGLSADEFTNYATNFNVVAFYSNSLTPVNPNMAAYFWTPYYSIIYQANSIIEGLEKDSGVSNEVKKQIKGEALFIRAFYHFYLTNLFGDIPIITSTDYKVNAILSRSIQVDVYKQIVTDLTDAKAMLNPEYIGSDGLTTGTDRVRPNLATAQALLARVYLYTKQYDKAEKESSLVIANSLYTLPDDLSTNFLKSSSEAIWQTQPVPNVTTTFADKFVLTGNPSTGLNRSIILSPSLMALFENYDNRISHYMGTRTYQGNTIRFVRKHKLTSSNSSEYNMIMRLAEQYLIRAEARLQLQMIEDGIADLNAIRRRANVAEYDYQTISNPLLLVEQERQRELFAEGHRWFDLHRTDRIDPVMTNVTPTKGGTWSSHSALYPIPETERTNNPQLSQNTDY